MHEVFLRRCLELAKRGRGKTGINPMVGAVLVRDGKIIAEAFHREFGKAHAERELLQKFDQIICSNDILYANLEPCCHSSKKTLPCTELIIRSGVKRVVFGMRDPNPQVSGKGIAALQKEGIEVIGSILEDECLRLNRGFVSLQNNLRPWVTLKIARTIDGKIAKDDGSMMKITSSQQNAWSHEYLRARHDAILVGVGTILTDDSRLTVRIPTLTPTLANARVTSLPGGEGTGERVPYRIILDSKLRIPLASKVVSDDCVSRTIVVSGSGSDEAKKSVLESRGVRVMECPMHGEAFDWNALWKLLTTPQELFYGISSILVEGGPKTWESFRKASFVDEEVILVGAENALRA